MNDQEYQTWKQERKERALDEIVLRIGDGRLELVPNREEEQVIEENRIWKENN